MQLVIPHVARNDDLLRRNIPYLSSNIKPDHIVVIAEHLSAKRLSGIHADIEFIDEDKVLPGLSLEVVSRRLMSCGVPSSRSGWYLQQFLKMGWALNKKCEEWYLVWDSDTFPLRSIAVFNADGKPVFRIKTEYNSTYFSTIKKLLGLEKIINKSFIAEGMLISSGIMRSLISDICAPSGRSVDSFYHAILDAITTSDNPYTAFSEFETYGTYAMTAFPELYQIESSKAFRDGAKYFGLKPNRYDLARLARRYDIVSFERWSRIILPFIWFQKSVSIMRSLLT